MEWNGTDNPGIITKNMKRWLAILAVFAIVGAGLATATEFRTIPVKEVFLKEFSPTMQVRECYNTSCSSWANTTAGNGTVILKCVSYDTACTCGKNTYIFDTADERITATKDSPFHAAKDITITAKFKRTDATSLVLNDKIAEFNQKYCWNGGNITSSELSSLKAELPDIFVKEEQGKITGKNKTKLDLFTDTEFSLKMDALIENRVFKARLGKHSILWSVTSQADWNNGTLMNITANDTLNGTIDNALVLDRQFKNDTSTVALWHLNQSINDTSLYPNGTGMHNLTLGSTATWADARFGSGLVTDATVNGIASSGTKNFPVGASSRTVEAWVKTTTPAGAQVFIGYGGAGTGTDFLLYVDTDGNFKLSGGGGRCNLDSGIFIGNNVWHHTAVTYDGTTCATYVDGIAGAATVTALVTSADTAFYLGKGSSNQTYYFAGTIDEVRISDVVRYTGAFTPHPYPLTGQFTSQVRDTGANYSFANLTLNGTYEVGTNITLNNISHSYDNSTWTTISGFTYDLTNATNGTPTVWNFVDFSARFLKFNVTLATNNTNVTSQLHDVIFNGYCEPPASGNWNMDVDCELVSGVWTLNGNLNVNGYTLTLDNNARLLTPASYYINLTSGSKIILMNGSRIN